VTEAQLRAVLSYGVFDIASRTMREGSDICGVFVEDDSGSYPADPVASNNVCYYGGQVNANKGDCAVKNSGDRRFCLCSRFGKGLAVIEEEHSLVIIVTYIVSSSRLVLEGSKSYSSSFLYLQL
jgi:hypothetical protein